MQCIHFHSKELTETSDALGDWQSVFLPLQLEPDDLHYRMGVNSLWSSFNWLHALKRSFVLFGKT